MGRRRVDPLEGGITPELQAMIDAREAIVMARQTMRDAVAAARDSGATWATIGAALGVTRQAAWERYGDPRRAHAIEATGREDLEGT